MQKKTMSYIVKEIPDTKFIFVTSEGIPQFLNDA